MDLLIGQGRVGRLRYFLTSLTITAVMAVAIVALGDTDPITDELRLTGEALIVIILGIWCQLMNMTRRLRDLGHRWYWMLLGLVPILGWALALYLLFIPGIPESSYIGFRRPTAEQHAAAAAHQQQLLNGDGSFDMDGLYRDSTVRRD